MDVSDRVVVPFRRLKEEELPEWEEAYLAVEAYLSALRVRNRLMVAELVREILHRASERQLREGREKSPRTLALEETLVEVSEWTKRVLGADLEHNRMAARGRLALLLTEMPGKWQSVFLTPEPWPPVFVDAMRKSYLSAGPGFAELTMAPKPLELNALGTGAAVWWDVMDRRPVMRKMIFGLLIVLIVSLLWLTFGAKG